VSVFLHAFAALMLGYFSFSSLFQGTHILNVQRWQTDLPGQPPVVVN
jgi:hypothetical protein